MDILTIVMGVVGLALGAGLMFGLQKSALKNQRKAVLDEAKKDAEIIKKEKLMQAKEKFLQLKEEHDKVIREKDNKANESQNRLNQKENTLNQKLAEANKKDQKVNDIRENLNVQLEVVEKQQTELSALHMKQVKQLESMTGMSAEDAKEQLKEVLINEAKTEAMGRMKDIVDEAKIIEMRRNAGGFAGQGAVILGDPGKQALCGPNLSMRWA